jgi:hypothetical protein
MSIPGFDADAALSRSRQPYRARPMAGPLGGSGYVTPQFGYPPSDILARCWWHCYWRRRYEGGRYGAWEFICTCYR